MRRILKTYDAVAVHVDEPQVTGVGAEHLAVLEEVVGRAVEVIKEYYSRFDRPANL